MNIIDLHCDTLYKFSKDIDYSFSKNDGHITDKALVEGNYLAQFFAVYVPATIKGEAAFSFFEDKLLLFEKLVCETPFLEKAKSKDEILNNKQEDKVSAILTIENAEPLNGKLERLSFFEKSGVKVLGLVHNGENCLVFPHNADKEIDALPLKPFGREVVDAVNFTDMLIDVSHLNYGGFCEVAELSKKPFIATHSACRAIFDHSRNLYDDQIVKIAKSGGIIGVAFYSEFLNGTKTTGVGDIIRHIEHLINIGGTSVVALGTDFDGMNCGLFLDTCAEMPILCEAIIKKFGFSVAEKVCYKNALRLL